METDDGEKMNHRRPSENTPVDHPMSCTLPTEQKVDLALVTTQEVVHISEDNDSKDLDRNENKRNNTAEMKSESFTDSEGMHHRNDMQAEMESAAVQLLPASSPSSTADMGSVVSLTTEHQQPPCSVANSVPEDESGLVEADEEQSDINSNMELDANPRDDAVIVMPNGEESTSSSAVVVNLEPIQPHTSSFSEDSAVADTASDSKGEESQRQSFGLGQRSENGIDLKCQENEESIEKGSQGPTDTPNSSNSSHSINNVSNKTKNDASVKPVRDEKCHESQNTGSTDVIVALDSNSAASPQSPPTSLPKTMDKGRAAQESSQANTTTPLITDVDMETSNCEVMADRESSLSNSKETEPVNCKSYEESPHLVCRQLSPVCLLPTIQLQALETPPNPDKLNVVVNILTENDILEPVHNLKDVSLTEKPANMQTSRRPTLSIENITPTKRQTRSVLSATKVAKKQSPHMTRKKQASPDVGSIPAKPPECLGQVRSEMGPPLPPALTPLTTPPKTGKSISPMQAIGKLSFPSPMDRLASPTTPVLDHMTPNSQQLSSLSLNSPLRPNCVPSSPLQFGSATPKHAVPVPGRLPVTAMNSSPSSSSSPSQENSMRMLDTMYPELSARARTLSILRGNVNLNICSSESGTLPAAADKQLSGFKTIIPASAAFVKAPMRGEKRQALNLSQPMNSKCLRLDSGSPPSSHEHVPSISSNSGEETTSPQNHCMDQPKNEISSQTMEDGQLEKQNRIVISLKKIENQCFDLLPVIQSHLYVGNLPKKPVLRDEEKEVISEICQSSLVSVLYYACSSSSDLFKVCIYLL